MVDVTVNYNAQDNCDLAAAVRLALAVTSNEPINGTGGGRIYTITIKATDSKGNSSTTTLMVRVPHSEN